MLWLLVVLVCAGIIMAMVPMDEKIKQIAYVVIVILVVVQLYWLFMGESTHLLHK